MKPNVSPCEGHRTTARVLDIIELVSQHKEGLSFSSIAKEIGMPKSSLHPLLHTLSDRNYLFYDSALQRYYLGEMCFRLGSMFMNSVDILKAIQREIEILAHETSEIVYMGVRHGSEVLYLAKAEADIAIRIVTAGVGHQLPAYCTGLGKALLLDLSLEELKALYPNGMAALTQNTITSVGALHEQLVRMKQQGYSEEKEESTIGIQCIGVPVRVDGKIIAALSSSVPIFRFNKELETQLRSKLPEVALKIAAHITANKDAWNRLCP